MSHPAKNCFLISNFPYLNTIWRTNSYSFPNMTYIGIHFHNFELSEKCKHLREIHKLTKSLKLSSKLHNCRICQENFSTSYLLSEHLVTKHPEDTDLVTSCPKSGCKFKCPKGSIRLRSHLQKFHNNEFADKIYKFECRICYGRFKSGDILKTHIMTKHDESHGRVKCPYCPYALPTKRKSDLYR